MSVSSKRLLFILMVTAQFMVSDTPVIMNWALIQHGTSMNSYSDPLNIIMVPHPYSKFMTPN